ncbi:MAG: hypothetical protein GXO19_05880, partial [Epsilonproteobacteria bacterium]|nr:hypothetical protein [Campylobacterota bacterium]NPA57244.1 hypothetical protein [Campylobacterota bacterium]
MRIENLIYLVGGELLNVPAIRSIRGITSHLARVRRGDLYIARDSSLVADAVERGAYAVLFQGEVGIIDPEIAWIRVEGLYESVQRLLRFSLVERRVTPIPLSPLTWRWTSQYITAPSVAVSRGDPIGDLEL